MDSRPLFSSNGSRESIWICSVPELVTTPPPQLTSCAVNEFMVCCKYGFTGCLPTEGSCSPVFERQPKCCQSIIAARDSLCCTIVQGRQCCAKYRTDVSCCENYRDGVCCKAVEKGISCVDEALSVQEWKMGDVARMHRVSASGQVGNRSWMGRAIRL